MSKPKWEKRDIDGTESEGHKAMNDTIRKAARRGTHTQPINPDWGKPKEKKDGPEGT